MSQEWGGNDRGPTTNAVTWATAALAIIFVGLRLVSRTCFGSNRIGMDDYITIGCLVIFVVSAILMTVAVENGLGKHIQDIPPPQISKAILSILVLNTVAVWESSLPKLAIVALLERLLRLGKWTRIFLWSLAGINQVFTLSLSILWWMRCTPTRANYDPTTPGAVCGSFQPLEIAGYITSVTNPVLDMVFAFYPIPMVMKLNLSLKKRIGVSVGLGIGAIASAVSFYKLSVVAGVVDELALDPTFAVVPINLFSHVEAALLLITASIPTLGPLIRFLQGKTPFGSQVRPSQYGRGMTPNGSRPDQGGKHRKLPDQSGLDTENDDMPLVTVGGHHHGFNNLGGIQKSTHISVEHNPV